MTRNNEERLGVKKPVADSPVVPSDDNGSSGFSFAIPTDFCRTSFEGKIL